jgi:Rho-binding antiterminator
VSDYRPIACSDHERLEFAALKRQWIEVTVKSGSSSEVQRLLPLDVYTRDGAEWLKAQTQVGDVVTLRLDALKF